MANVMDEEWQLRNRELLAAVAKQPYDFTYRNIVVRVDKDVFPPDIGFTTTLLADVLAEKRASCALDMGTGTLLCRDRGQTYQSLQSINFSPSGAPTTGSVTTVVIVMSDPKSPLSSMQGRELCLAYFP
jgi:hypothetical protein